MGTYKNDYSKSEDETLWELHEIRHKLHKKFQKKTMDEINKEATNKFESWKKEKISASKQTV
ncbi:MAG: hypothetical protein A2W19_08735 [Spirochaetes bacterium RBG_16_49_21]|nr:MAG: hypothetical protein A2W19_08735 [Spirochaetes bacterium RBG_16_49_21]